MRRSSGWMATALALVALNGLHARAEDPPKAPAAPPAPPAPAPVAPPAGANGPESRAALTIPDDVWARALEGLGLAQGATLGYSVGADGKYGRDQLVTRPIATMFRDVRAIPRCVGKALRHDPRGGAGSVRAGPHRLRPHRRRRGADARASEGGRVGRRLARRDGDALPTRSRRCSLAWRSRRRPGRRRRSSRPSDARAWRSLPEALQRLVVRILVGCAEGAPWMRSAFDVAFVVEAIAAAGRRRHLARPPARRSPRGRSSTATTTRRRPPAPRTQGVVRAAAPLRPGVAGVRLRRRAAPSLGRTRGVAPRPRRDRRPQARRSRRSSSRPRSGPSASSAPATTSRTRAPSPRCSRSTSAGTTCGAGRQACPRRSRDPISLLVDLAGNDRYDAGDDRRHVRLRALRAGRRDRALGRRRLRGAGLVPRLRLVRRGADLRRGGRRSVRRRRSGARAPVTSASASSPTSRDGTPTSARSSRRRWARRSGPACCSTSRATTRTSPATTGTARRSTSTSRSRWRRAAGTGAGPTSATATAGRAASGCSSTGRATTATTRRCGRRAPGTGGRSACSRTAAATTSTRTASTRSGPARTSPIGCHDRPRGRRPLQRGRRDRGQPVPGTRARRLDRHLDRRRG